MLYLAIHTTKAPMDSMKYFMADTQSMVSVHVVIPVMESSKKAVHVITGKADTKRFLALQIVADIQSVVDKHDPVNNIHNQ